MTSPANERDLIEAAREQQDRFDAARREYLAGLDAANPSNRFLRKRTGLGGDGDARLNAHELWFVRETVRHMVHNDLLPGQAMERLCDLLMSPPFRLKPDTGDEGLDAELLARFNAWASDPVECDYYGERTFDQLAWLYLYRQFVDGDIGNIGACHEWRGVKPCRLKAGLQTA